MEKYIAPSTEYFQTKAEFNEAVGKDFINTANRLTKKDKEVVVGLSHGKSPSGAYAYILEHFGEIIRPGLLHFIYINTPLKSQRDLINVIDAQAFISELIQKKLISGKQILGEGFVRENLDTYASEFNKTLARLLKNLQKEGLDYVFLASNPKGRVAAITRNSTAFQSTEIGVVVKVRTGEEFTMTPDFLKKSQHIAFLATKADKRRALAWLFYQGGKENESPGFLRHIHKVNERMTVYIDDDALTWPQIEIERKTGHGTSTIRVDVAHPYKEEKKKKLPVVLLIHGFLGLNSYDGLLTAIPSHKYLAAAMHYGSVPQNLPPGHYSKNIVDNIDAVVQFFGSKGHPVYLFDHSIANIYFLIINRDFDKLKSIKKYLKGRIGANPFFGNESKHASIGFLDYVLIPSLAKSHDTSGITLFKTARRIVPFDTKKGVRKRGIRLSEWLISKESPFRERIWKEAKDFILSMMSSMDTLPHLNRIPIERALSRLPVKLFAIQIHSALEESKSFDRQKGIDNFEKHKIPVLILKSDRDPIAKFVPEIYESDNVQVFDITDQATENMFQEHLYHMVNPRDTAEVIDRFVQDSL